MKPLLATSVGALLSLQAAACVSTAEDSSERLAVSSNETLAFPLPSLSPIVNPSSVHCRAIVSTYLHGQRGPLFEKGIFGILKEGTDTLAVQIENDVLYFMTNEGFESGSAKGTKFEIVTDSDELVIAMSSEGERTIDVFTLDKTTGLAVWTKTRSQDLSFGSPSAQSFQLICR